MTLISVIKMNVNKRSNYVMYNKQSNSYNIFFKPKKPCFPC